jgi:hypothetical protein
MFTFCNYCVLKLSRLETITFSDATLSNINVVLCYVLSQYHAVQGGLLGGHKSTLVRYKHMLYLCVIPPSLHLPTKN